MNSNNEFNYEIKKQIAVLSEKNGYTVELNLISYRGASPKLDLRKWNRNNDTMQKGITLTTDEATALKDALERYLNEVG